MSTWCILAVLRPDHRGVKIRRPVAALVYFAAEVGTVFVAAENNHPVHGVYEHMHGPWPRGQPWVSWFDDTAAFNETRVLVITKRRPDGIREITHES
jgi:hypothetical protein